MQKIVYWTSSNNKIMAGMAKKFGFVGEKSCAHFSEFPVVGKANEFLDSLSKSICASFDLSATYILKPVSSYQQLQSIMKSLDADLILSEWEYESIESSQSRIESFYTFESNPILITIRASSEKDSTLVLVIQTPNPDLALSGLCSAFSLASEKVAKTSEPKTLRVFLQQKTEEKNEKLLKLFPNVSECFVRGFEKDLTSVWDFENMNVDRVTPKMVMEKLKETGLSIKEVVNQKDSKLKSPLHYAIQGQLVDLSQYLLENGANVDAKNAAGQTGTFILLTNF